MNHVGMGRVPLSLVFLMPANIPSSSLPLTPPRAADHPKTKHNNVDTQARTFQIFTLRELWCLTRALHAAQMMKADSMDVLAEERDREVRNILTSIADLAQIMKDLSTLVIDQGTVLDRIDYNMEQARAVTNLASNPTAWTSRGIIGCGLVALGSVACQYISRSRGLRVS